MAGGKKHRGLVSTSLISFFLSSFAGFLWIGRGALAFAALAVSILVLIAGFYLFGFEIFYDNGSLTGFGGNEFGFLIDVALIGLVHVAIVLPFRKSTRSLKWYSNGFAVLGITLVLPATLALFIRTFLFQPFSIPSNSMDPALQVGDHMFISKFAYGYSRHSAPFSLLPVNGRIFARQPARGDVAVFKFPPNSSIDYVKRVVGLPGERIKLVDGVLHIDDTAVELQRNTGTRSLPDLDRDAEVQIETLPNGVSYQILNLADDTLGDNTREFVVPDNHYFVLGDNRDNSTDSRFNVGFIPFELMVGRVELIYWNSNGRNITNRK